MTSVTAPHPHWRRVLQVFTVFLQLGLTSFGGPVAHLGYFRTAFVQRRQWLSDAQYADLVALCQFLPGPASSQVGMALGQLRAGSWGALAAWLGFTLPSALLLMALAVGLSQAPHSVQWAHSGLLHGLKLVAVAVVAQAVWGMGRSLCPDRLRAAMALGAAVLAVALPGTGVQLLVIALGALVGWRWVRPALPAASAASSNEPTLQVNISRRTGAALLLLCLALGLALPLLAYATQSPLWQAGSVFYQAGALVFGGGHVVLPLLQNGVVQPGWLDNAQFLTGYAAAQAVPGPLFTLAAYLGALLPLGAWTGWAGGLLALFAIFLPAALLVLGALPFWAWLRTAQAAQRVLAGVNAAVVGLLLAALYDPVWTSAILGRQDCALALLYLALLTVGRLPPVAVVLLGAIAGVALG
ncbi:MAG: chromate efflux transporter [Acidovorax sp.]|nr:chromate efflux transporter [Acidovorax sp.]